MAHREIPGFYYDEEKNRYFKIETHPTAPANAAWAAGNVKKRKAEKAKVQLKRKRHEKLKWCVKRSSLLANPLSGGRLLREFGVVDPEIPVESWTAGLRQRGEVSFLPGHEQNPDAPSISCLLVEGGEEAAGLGMAFAGIGRRQLQCCYLPTDKDEKINFGITEKMRASRLSAVRAEEIQGGISSIAYHQASHRMVVVSSDPNDREMTSRGRITLFQPFRPTDFSEDDNAEGFFLRQYGGQRPSWLLGETNSYVSYASPLPGLTMHAVRTCPASTSGSSFDALIATSHGIMYLGGPRAAGEITWLTPRPSATKEPGKGRYQYHDGAGVSDFFTVDYHPSNPRVCFAGCRNSKVLRVDTRAPVASAAGLDSPFRHRSSAAHVRCLDDHRVLVAGPRSAMAIYDTRWAKPTRSAGGGSNRAAQPVVEFPGYRNEAHVKIGLDVTHDVGGSCGGGGGGAVAAALGDGTVGVFSLRTGRRLRAGDVDDPRVLRATGAGGVVKALQFRRLPWEKEASLFVGVGPMLRKFTFGVGDDEDEW